MFKGPVSDILLSKNSIFELISLPRIYISLFNLYVDKIIVLGYLVGYGVLTPDKEFHTIM